MELMQGYCKDGGLAGIDNLARWPDNFLAIDFLSVTNYAHSVSQLLNVRLRPFWFYEDDYK